MKRLPPFIDSFAAITPRITGGLSAISSSTLIYLILRSEARLSTIYHRIMFGMSFFDIIGSISMGLSTIPMPKDLDDEVFWYQDEWVGTRLGNVHTCGAQGFGYLFGTYAMYAYNTSLCIYYACALCFKIKERNIVKFVEPILHLFPITLAFVIVLRFHFNFVDVNQMNLGLLPWCAGTAGLRSPPNTNNSTKAYNMPMMVRIGFALLGIILVCFALILWRVNKTQRTLHNLTRTHTSEHASGRTSKRFLKRRTQFLNEVIKTNDNTKVILVQATVYVCAFLFTLAPTFLRSLFIYFSKPPLWTLRFIPIFTPLQGFFNVLIYIMHRVYNYRRIHPDVKILEVVRMLFVGKGNDSLLLSRISIISVDSKHEVMVVQVENENNNVEHMSIRLTESKVNHAPQSFQDDMVLSKDLSVGPGSASSVHDLSYPNSHMRSTSSASNGVSFASKSHKENTDGLSITNSSTVMELG